ncbi:hypothetical protein [Bowmanella sp. JS7-9]|uniref:Lipoprotein n=1 Tax=Pseudobowmanella zhangzhouensis TaxID=1537679 RepID=A0ABW1XPC3_9ALTE|nr:hypothetical protein [Bowmanella sp. JS7-9]TBX23676.1 hypothetical protein TK45_06080 [Bowmanella sp. JS7-9]
MSKILRSFVLLMLLFSLLGCGGEEGTEAEPPKVCTQTSIYYCPSSAFTDPFGISFTLAWYSGQCTREVVCADDPNLPAVDPANGIIDDNFIAANWTTSSLTDKEPNSTFDQAQPFILRASSGVLIRGSLDANTDQADMYAFIVDGDASILIYLCETPDDCLQPWYQGDQMYLALYDHNRVLLDTTAVPEANGHVFSRPYLIPGEQYFIAVHASTQLTGTLEYKLVVTD